MQMTSQKIERLSARNSSALLVIKISPTPVILRSMKEYTAVTNLSAALNVTKISKERVI